MRTLLAKARAEYDVVIVDAPPLLPVTDGALLSAQADGAILVVRRGKTTKDQLAEAYQRLVSVDAKVLGAVLNMAPERGADSYGYGYGYAPLETVTARSKGRRAKIA
jgi:receptor protein-tyrosine kinase